MNIISAAFSPRQHKPQAQHKGPLQIDSDRLAPLSASVHLFIYIYILFVLSLWR